MYIWHQIEFSILKKACADHNQEDISSNCKTHTMETKVDICFMFETTATCLGLKDYVVVVVVVRDNIKGIGPSYDTLEICRVVASW